MTMRKICMPGGEQNLYQSNFELKKAENDCEGSSKQTFISDLNFLFPKFLQVKFGAGIMQEEF